MNEVQNDALKCFNIYNFNYREKEKRLEFCVRAFSCYKDIFYQKVNAFKEIEWITVDDYKRYINREDFYEILSLCKKHNVKGLNIPIDFSISDKDFEIYRGFEFIAIETSNKDNKVSLDCNNFKNINALTFERCDLEIKNIPDNSFLSVLRLKNNTLYIDNLGSLRCLILSYFKNLHIKCRDNSKLKIHERLFIDGVKGLSFDENIDFFSTKEIYINNSVTDYLTEEIRKKLDRSINIKFINSNIKSVKGLEKMDFVCVMDSLIEDLDTEPLIECNGVFFTSKKGYNYSFREVTKIRKEKGLSRTEDTNEPPFVIFHPAVEDKKL